MTSHARRTIPTRFETASKSDTIDVAPGCVGFIPLSDGDVIVWGSNSGSSVTIPAKEGLQYSGSFKRFGASSIDVIAMFE